MNRRGRNQNSNYNNEAGRYNNYGNQQQQTAQPQRGANYQTRNFVSGGQVGNFNATPSFKDEPAVQQQQTTPKPQQQQTPKVQQQQQQTPKVQQQQQTPKPQQQQQQQQLQQQQQQQQPLQTQQQPQPLTKEEKPESMERNDSGDENGDKTDETGVRRRPWIIKKGKKVPTRVRRMRQNKRLRKLLTPKNALMSLNELTGISVSDYNVSSMDNGFVAEVLVNSIRYEGRGPSKMIAKNNASEKALRDQIIQKMLLSKGKIPTSSVKLTGDSDGEDVEMKDSDDEPTEVPMVHLASFALYKLFNEWQQDGFEIPDLKSLGVEKATETPNKPVRTELPENAHAMHPSMLLTIMRPRTEYLSMGCEGPPHNIVHKFGITVDGKTYVGTSRNKKSARKNAAAEVCNDLFGTKFEIEVLPMPAPPAPKIIAASEVA